MSGAPHTHAEHVPSFSVIIPLEFHRDRWEQCLQAWQAQTLDDHHYELVLVMPLDFEERDQLAALLAQTNCLYRVVASDLNHDMGLCALGAEQACGRFLFFTESHCWPEPDVLALCLHAFDERHDWAGLSCRSLPVSSNRLGAVEAEMYDADITHGMTVHPWRKILDQCFVTRRETYFQCGGFKPEFGHFAEWALAANYHALGLVLGYLPEARFYHQYIGDLGVLRDFSLDFVRGEIRYLAEASDEPGSHLIEMPEEWIARGNFDRPLARTLLKQVLRDARRRERLSTALRWLGPSIFGHRWGRTKAAVGERAAYVRLRFATMFRSSGKLSDAFKTYVAAIAHSQRLTSTANVRTARRRPLDAGLFRIETAGGKEFRWSETAAAVRIELPAGKSTIVLDCAQIFLLPTIAHLRFRLDGQAVPSDHVQIDPLRIVIDVRVDRAGSSTLSWTCSRLDAPDDPRVLGLPVAKIELVAAA